MNWSLCHDFLSRLGNVKKVFNFSLTSKVLIFCVEIWELSNLTRDLSQAQENKYCYKLSKFTEWHLLHLKWSKYHFVHLLTLWRFIFFSAWDKSLIKWDNSENSTQKTIIEDWMGIETYTNCISLIEWQQNWP